MLSFLVLCTFSVQVYNTLTLFFFWGGGWVFFLRHDCLHVWNHARNYLSNSNCRYIFKKYTVSVFGSKKKKHVALVTNKINLKMKSKTLHYNCFCVIGITCIRGANLIKTYDNISVRHNKIKVYNNKLYQGAMNDHH